MEKQNPKNGKQTMISINASNCGSINSYKSVELNPFHITHPIVEVKKMDIESSLFKCLYGGIYSGQIPHIFMI